MEYQNTDEAARLVACERVKQIVKAIKAIKIKYYLTFSKISAKDQEMYQKLEASLERISESHNLNNLKIALMQEIEKKYDELDLKDNGTGSQHQPDDILQACYGAVDAEIDALSRGRITQAIRCQEQLKKYRQQLDVVNDKEIRNYKREKLAGLGITKEQVEEQIKSWNSTMKGCYKIKDVKRRSEVMDTIQSLSTKEVQLAKDTDEPTITI